MDTPPEQVTDMKRWLIKSDVVASTFDQSPEEHVAIAELTIERAKRMVELGEDVAVIIDGMTSLLELITKSQITTAEATQAILMRLLYISQEVLWRWQKA